MFLGCVGEEVGEEEVGEEEEVEGEDKGWTFYFISGNKDLHADGSLL